jgi:hypothetical protein
MPLRNPQWYDLNESRPWPIADQALLTDDDGTFLPNDILADLQLRFPDTHGDLAYIGSISVSPTLGSVVLMSDTGVVLAAASVASPIAGQHYPLDAIQGGVAGWIVFGTGVDDATETRSWRFSTYAQSSLMPHVARRYLTTTRMTLAGKTGVLGGSTGVVRLSGGDDMEIVKESREINGVVRDVGVVRLRRAYDETSENNVLAKYRGECGNRAESGDCGTPIQFINSVTPDCCGNIVIEFRGCSEVQKILGECGVVINCDFGLGEACIASDRLPDADGVLPNEYDDQCVLFSSSLSLVPYPESLISDTFGIAGALHGLITNGQGDPPGGSLKSWSETPSNYTVALVGGNLELQLATLAGALEIGPFITLALSDGDFDAKLEFTFTATGEIFSLTKYSDASNYLRVQINPDDTANAVLTVHEVIATVDNQLTINTFTKMVPGDYVLYAKFKETGDIDGQIGAETVSTNTSNLATVTSPGLIILDPAFDAASVSEFTVTELGVLF